MAVVCNKQGNCSREMWFKERCLLHTAELFSVISTKKSGFGRYLGKFIKKKKKCQHVCDYVNPMTTKSCMRCLVFQINYSRTSITNLPYSSVLCLQVRMWILCFWATKKKKINLKKEQDYSCFALCARRHLFLCMKIDPRLYVDYGLLISKQKIA